MLKPAVVSASAVLAALATLGALACSGCSKNSSTVVCMANDIGTFDFGAMEGASFVPGFVKTGIFGGSVFPIKFVEFDAGGNEKSRVEATRIERKTEDDADFAPPAGYAKFDIGNFGPMGGFDPRDPHRPSR